MTDYKLYPNLPPSAPPENPQVAYHLSIIQAKQRELKNKEQRFRQKYEKYNKILNRLMWLNACSSGISIATGISSVATFAIVHGQDPQNEEKLYPLSHKDLPCDFELLGSAN